MTSANRLLLSWSRTRRAIPSCALRTRTSPISHGLSNPPLPKEALPLGHSHANCCHHQRLFSFYQKQQRYHLPQSTKTFTTTIPCRSFTSTSWNKKKKGGLRRRNMDPFRILKITRKTPYAQVKKMFLKIAMSNHPDTSGHKTEAEQARAREIFIKARQAFELLVENPDCEHKGVMLRDELEDSDQDEDEAHAHMDSWFKTETGLDMPFMDEQTMREVAKMTETLSVGGNDRGLDRDGGMWELARQVTRTVNSGGDGKNLLRLEAGEVPPDDIEDRGLRARRRKKHR